MVYLFAGPGSLSSVGDLKRLGGLPWLCGRADALISKIPALTTLLLQGAPTVMWLFYTVVTKTLTEPDFSSFDLPVWGIGV